jgi:dimethylamine monooxygenase subunit C
VTTSTIKSRPIYPGLSPDLHARSNVIVCDRAGAEAAVELFARAGGEFGKRATVIVAGDSLPQEESRGLTHRLAPAKVEVTANIAAAVAELRNILDAATMGIRLYVAGSEPLIGFVVQAAIDHSIDPLSVRTEHRGSLMRRVQCVHCKGFIENVTANPVICVHCGLTLLVRDHYSRRLAAFQGVCIDAEVPGEVPETEALYQ